MEPHREDEGNIGFTACTISCSGTLAGCWLWDGNNIAMNNGSRKSGRGTGLSLPESMLMLQGGKRKEIASRVA
jgi:hypothetical protein